MPKMPKQVTYSNSFLRAVIGGHEPLMREASRLLRDFHKESHDWHTCPVCNVITRIEKSQTGLYGDD